MVGGVSTNTDVRGGPTVLLGPSTYEDVHSPDVYRSPLVTVTGDSSTLRPSSGGPNSPVQEEATSTLLTGGTLSTERRTPHTDSGKRRTVSKGLRKPTFHDGVDVDCVQSGYIDGETPSGFDLIAKRRCRRGINNDKRKPDHKRNISSSRRRTGRRTREVSRV